MRNLTKKISKYKPSILQGTLHFSAARSSISFAAQHSIEHALFKSMIFVLVALACSYSYFVGVSIMNVVAGKEALAESTQLESAIATMEQEYFALSQGVDESVIDSLGLTTVQHTAYVYEPSGAVAATIPGNGI